MNVYKPSWAARFLIGFLMLLPAVILFGVAAALEDARIVCAIIGLAIGAPGLWLWIAVGRMQLTIGDAEVRRQGLFGGEVKLAFAEVAEYRYRIYYVEGSEQLIITLVGKNGVQIKLTSNWRGVYEAARQLIDAVEAQLGNPSFGPITLEPDAISYKGKRLLYSEIDEAKQVGTAVRVSKKGKLLAPISVRTDKVPNLFLLFDALRERGVAAPDPRPWRAVVSVAGYAVPKK